jgi:hypothetical protein
VLHRRWRGRAGGVWWSSAVALQGEAANHREVRRSRAGVLSVAEMARVGARQVWAKKASVSELLMTCRNLLDEIETGSGGPARDEPGGCLLIGQVVSGMEAARAWSGLRCGTCEPVVPRPWAASGAVVACGRGGSENLKRLGPRGGE